jgi:hypothetical protein
MQRLSLLLLLAAGLNGCASKKGNGLPAAPVSAGSSGDRKPTEAIVTPASGTMGRVTAVNANARFVVLSYPVGTLPALERRLNVFRGGLKVAELKVTGPTRDTHTVADILAGDCQIGDEARED